MIPPIDGSVATTQYIIESHSPTSNSSYIIDSSDLNYYQQQLSNTNSKTKLEESFKQQLKLRGIDYKDTNDQLYILQDYIINEIIPQHQQPNEFIDIDIDIDNLIQYDTQNVHDTSIQRQLCSTFNDVSNSSIGDVKLDDILHFAHTLNKSPTQLEQLSRVLKVIYSRNSRVTNFDNTEVGILSRTWNTPGNGIRQQIINNLVDCFENNDVVCPTGTTSRIVESLYINEPSKIPTTSNLYKEEMLSKASIVLQELQNTQEFNNLSEQEQKIAFKTKLLNVYTHDYNGILDSQQITLVVQDWIDYII
jgi:hypothetical protein